MVSFASKQSPGQIANGGMGTQKHSASPGGDGNYLIRNVATGEYLYFERDGIVGAYLGDVQTGLNLETATYNGVTGVIIKGTTIQTTKCLAAQ